MGATDDVQVGPWGGKGNYPFKFKPDGKIIKIYIRTGGSGGCIDSIKFGYVRPGSSQEEQSPKYGGEGGHIHQEMYIGEPGEEIIELSGKVGTYNNYTVITSLLFKTNKKSFLFGSKSGEKFSLPVIADTTKFVGFHGKSGSYLDSIGAILVPK